MSGRASIIEYGIERFNEHCRTSVLRYTAEWEKTVTRQGRWVDFEQRLQDHGPRLHGVGHVGVQAALGQGLLYEANRVMPYSWGAETPLSNFEIRLDDATRPRQDPAVTIAFDLDPRPGDPGTHADPGLDHDPLDPAVQPGAGGRPRHRVRGRGRGGDGEGRRSLRPRRRDAGDLRTPARAGAHRRRHRPRRGSGRTHLHTAVPLLRRRRPRRRSGSSAATSSTPPRAPASSTSPPGSARTTSASREANGIGIVVPVDDRAASPTTSPNGPARTCSRRTRRSSVISRRPGGSSATTPTPTTIPTAGGPTPRSSTGRCRVVVRQGHRHTRPPRRTQPADQLGARPRPRRALRHVARRRPRLVDLAQPLLGITDTGVEERRPRPTRASTSTEASTSSSATSACARPTCTARYRRARSPEPGRSHRPLDDASGTRGPRLLVRVGLDALRAGALPVREQGLVREPLPGRLHRRVHQPDPRLVLHAARAGGGAVRQAGVRERHLPRHPARRRRRQAVEEAPQLHRARRDLRDARAPMPCAGTSCPATSCAAATPASATRRSTTSCGR